MDKKVFVNDEIFESDADYIIGGFETDKTDNFNIGDFSVLFKERIEKLLSEYLQTAEQANERLGKDDPLEARKDAALLISDNLDVKPEYFSFDSLIDAIYDSPQAQAWVMKIRQNIHDLIPSLTEMNEESEQYQLAKDFTDDSTLEMLIEQLSTIEL